MQDEVNWLEQVSANRGVGSVPRYLLERLILDSGYLQTAAIDGIDAALRTAASEARERLTTQGQSLAALETIARYQWVAGITDGVIAQREGTADTISDRLDRVLTHRWLGPLLFAALMLLIFQAVFNGAVWFMDSIEAGLGQVSDLIAASIPPVRSNRC